jgi:hypothetical protein
VESVLSAYEQMDSCATDKAWGAHSQFHWEVPATPAKPSPLLFRFILLILIAGNFRLDRKEGRTGREMCVHIHVTSLDLKLTAHI